MMHLNPGLDPDALRHGLEEAGRLQIKDFLAGEDAERVYQMLMSHTPWWTAFNVGEKVAQVSPEMASRLTPAQVQEFMTGIQVRARTEYQFLYNYYPVLGHYFDRSQPWVPVYEAYEFLNSTPVLDFFREVTGRPDIRWADAQATLYRAGHFLKRHTDEQHSEKRIAAYVLNLTKGWDPDWGGFLQFFDADRNIEQAFRPAFNALNIFLIPALHSVGMVANYAPGHRYSITGWLRGDDPPGAFDRLPA